MQNDAFLDQIVQRYVSDHAAELETKDPQVDQNAITQAVKDGLEEASALVYDDLKRGLRQMVNDGYADRVGFEARLHARWWKALELYEAIRTGCLEAGSQFNEKHRAAAMEANDLTFEVLVRLHARACSIASEVYSLLTGGHATAAMARWRSLHEIAVVAYFVRQHGDDVAERYLLHAVVESCRAGDDYERCYEKLGYQAPDPQYHQELRERKAALIQRFGPEYGECYGWAAEALRSRKPTLAALESAVSLDHMRAHYRMASHGVHPNPKGITFNLGLLGITANDVMVAGPSNAGLADPAMCTMIALYQCTATLLCSEPDAESVISLLAIGRFLQEAEEAFGEIHEQQASEEAENAQREPDA